MNWAKNHHPQLVDSGLSGSNKARDGDFLSIGGVDRSYYLGIAGMKFKPAEVP